MGHKISKEQIDPGVKDHIMSFVGDIADLETEENTDIISAVNSLMVDRVDNAENMGKLANAIGEPVTANHSVDEVVEGLGEMLSTFKTNMMNSGVMVESSDKFKQLIDKIKGLTEGEGNKGIQFAEGDLNVNIPYNNAQWLDAGEIVVPLSLDFTPTYIFIDISLYNSNLDLYNNDFYISNMLSSKIVSGNVNGYFSLKNVSSDGFTIRYPRRPPNYVTITNKYYAIGVGEEDTTLRDSLASILQEEGVGVTEEDGMASLISKVDSEFDRKNECINNNKNELLDILIKNGIDVSNIDNIDDVISLLNMLVIKSKTVRQIVAYNHTLVLKDDGSLWGCGPNTYGELGIGKKEEAVKALYEIQNDVKQVSCGFWYSFILKNDGSVYSCGYNDNGQLGFGNSGEYTYKTSFTQVTTNINNDVKQIACGNSHTFILKNDGSLWSCGFNNNGQLGLGDTAKRTTFTQVTTNINNDVKQVVCGGDTTFIIKTDGSLWATGYNRYGQLGLGDTTNRNTFTQVTTNINNDVKQVACGFGQSLVLKNDGSLWGCGYNGKYIGFGNGTIGNTFTQVTTNINNDVKYVACGDDCSFIIKNDETVWVCGEGGSAQLGTNTFDNFNVFTKIPNGFLN